VPGLLGNAHPNIVPYQVFPTADGNIIISIGNDAQFERFCRYIKRPEFSSDERFKTNENRVRNRNELTDILNQITSQQTSESWLTGLDEIKIASGPINRIDEALANPQVQAREMEIQMNHPAAGNKPVKMLGSPIKMSGTPVSYRRTPPMLGEHTDEVLSEILNLDAAACDKLRANGTI
jgi:crotonobetainyl-CoA:carnitine CoA-transferase CaiB-like acyl-CoA transferase